jgi:MOSC domain-containing protein YiiM
VRHPVGVVYVPLVQLEAGIDVIRRSPSEHGRIELIARRPEVESREVIVEARLDEREGLVGDSWRERGTGATGDGSANPDTQITIMNARSVAVIAGDRQRWPLAGDQLYVDFDLSVANLPPGTPLEVGSALLEVTAVPHRGCGKFSKRFGVDAMKFVNSAVGRELNLRGINARVLRGGSVRTGDPIRKLPA